MRSTLNMITQLAIETQIHLIWFTSAQGKISTGCRKVLFTGRVSALTEKLDAAKIPK